MYPKPLRNEATSPAWLTPDAPLFTVAPPVTGEVMTAQGKVPAGIVDVPLKWMFEVATPLLGALVLAWLTQRCIRQRRLGWDWLFVVCAASTWWMETIGDWGQQLLYSPDFVHYTWPLPFTMPHNPYFMPFAYAFYWWIQAVLALKMAEAIAARRGWSVGKAILVIAVPLSFVWDFLVEGTAAYLGWWTYNPAVGPYVAMGRSNMPLLWPMILMFIWPNLIAWLAHTDPRTGLNRIERAGGMGRPGTPSRWRGLRRLGLWLAAFQLSFFLINVLPLAGVWYVLGYDSPWLQCHPNCP